MPRLTQLNMATKKEAGYIEKLLKKADKAIDDGIKKADKVLENAVEVGTIAAGQAKKTSTELKKRAKTEKDNIKARGIKSINEGISAAKKATTDTSQDLETLERLGELRKSGVITEKEFQTKKKKILERI